MKRILPLLALAALTTAGVAALVSAPPAALESGRLANAAAAAGPAPASRSGRLTSPPPQTELGESLSYRLVSTTDLTLSGEPDAASPDPGEAMRLVAELSGLLRATSVELRDNATVLQLTLSDARTETTEFAGTKRIERNTQNLAGLDRAFYAEYGPAGDLIQVYLPPETALEHRNTMRTVAAAMQVSPPPADRDVWSTPQVVAGATVDVQYRPLGPDTYERTFETDERTGRATLAIRDRRLTRLRSDETLSSAALGLVGAGSMTLELVHRDQRAQAVDQWRRDRAMVVAAGVSTEVDRAAAEEASFSALDDGTPVTDLLAMLRGLAPGSEAERERSYLMRRLAARFALHPEEARTAGEAVADLAPHEAATVVGALSAVGNAETEQSLARITADETAPAGLIADAANALSFHDRPGDVAIEALAALADSDQRDRRGPGLLGLGSVSFRLGQSDDPRGERLVRDLIRRFAAATTEQDQVDLLAALGNTGSELILPTLEAVVAGNNPRLRHEAVVSLRLVTTPRADELLARFLAADVAVDLRRAALFAARFRPIEPLLSALSALLQVEPDADVRGEALELVGERLGDLAEAADMIARVAERDPEERLRRRARELLETA